MRGIRAPCPRSSLGSPRCYPRLAALEECLQALRETRSGPGQPMVYIRVDLETELVTLCTREGEVAPVARCTQGPRGSQAEADPAPASLGGSEVGFIQNGTFIIIITTTTF